MKTMQIAAVAAVMASTAVGLAGPASAELTPGDYTLIYTASNAPFKPGSVHETLTPCGASCMRMTNPGGKVTELHLQGSDWVGTQTFNVQGQDCTSGYSINRDSLTGTVVDSPCNSLPPSESNVSLTRNG